ncbi:XdhC family protein [Nonomuraea sp. NPDC050394]|uniref:XdhC family protein n=1 Tax=Nonomuraea sp. NPDC050394 TaxID=3364363 RepID=UPI0037AC123F
MLREVWPFVEDHHRAGRPLVLARLVSRDGPGSRPLGATLALAADGTWRGSLSGGCVEGIALDAAQTVLDGATPHLATICPTEHLLPWEAAPACTGNLGVLITPAPGQPVHDAITDALAHDHPLWVRVGLQPPYPWSAATTPDELPDSDGPAFIEHLPRRRRLILIGATDLAATLAHLAEPLHRAVTVIDPRPAHLHSGAFPHTTTLIEEWPDTWLTQHPLHAGDALIALSHDPRIDDRALRAALPGPATHIAALGSRATHAQRLHRLTGTPGLDRLIGPAGLDLGATTTAETALSILAELTATENGRSGRRLRDGHHPIHPQPPLASLRR